MHIRCTHTSLIRLEFMDNRVHDRILWILVGENEFKSQIIFKLRIQCISKTKCKKISIRFKN